VTEVAQFSSYIGLVVLISAVVLLAPRATVAAWATFCSWWRSRWQNTRAWRPRTVRAEPRALPVDVRVGARFHRHDPEVLEPEAPEGARRAARQLWWLSREVVEVGAVLLAVVAVLLRSAGSLVDLLPEPAVLAGDLSLVLATFLMMARIIRDYPADLLPSVRFPRRQHPGRVLAVPVRRRGRLDHALGLVALAVGLLVLLAWPSELGQYLGERRFGSPRAGALVAWALELPWLVTLAGVLLRESSTLPAPALQPPIPHPHTQPLTARVVAHLGGEREAA